MAMNNNGQVFFYTIMLGIILIVLALALAGPVKDIVDSARNETTDEGQFGLNCTNPELSNFDKGTCIVSDLSIFHYISGIIFIAGSIITARLVFL